MKSQGSTLAVYCEDVHKSYPIHKSIRLRDILFGNPARQQVIHALRGVSMQVPSGRIVGVIGRNGAGKSTLLRVLAGVYEPSAGRVAVVGDIAGLFELGGFGNLNLTGRAYAQRYLGIMGASTSRYSALLDDIREFSELEDAFEEAILTYSSGMRARLYFATATALQSDVYLIDELLSVGDEHFQSKCWLRMRERLLNGASGVLITHDWSAVLKLCEQTCVIEKGEFRYVGESDKAVVRYLNIPTPQPTAARLAPDNPMTYTATSGEDAALEFLVEVLERGAAVEFAVSVEMLRIGAGWEIVLLQDQIEVAAQPGRYRLRITICQLPLTPGDYSLNIFLSGYRDALPGVRQQFDIRSWTLGTGLRLQVGGTATAAAVRLPYEVRQGAEVA